MLNCRSDLQCKYKKITREHSRQIVREREHEKTNNRSDHQENQGGYCPADTEAYPGGHGARYRIFPIGLQRQCFRIPPEEQLTLYRDDGSS